MNQIRADEKLPSVGIYHAFYNGDHVIFQVHDGGFRVINYHGERDDFPKLYLIKWLDESPIQEGDIEKALTQIRNELYDNVPTGNVDAFDLLKIINTHLKKLDAFIAGYKAALNTIKQEQ